MKKIILTIFSVIAFVMSSKCKAVEFLDTSRDPNLFTFGARLGFNTSNRTFPSGSYNLWNHNSWGLGFNAGVLANLNFREYFTIQPGIFYESRSGDYTYLTEYLDYYNREQEHYEMGHLRGYYVTIPVMALFKFNLSENIKWNVEFGPYVQYCFSETGQNNIVVLYRLPQSNQYGQYKATHRRYDAGLKLGTGLQFSRHFYAGVHYLAGLIDVWVNPQGGKNKSWQFSIGYDF